LEAYPSGFVWRLDVGRSVSMLSVRVRTGTIGSTEVTRASLGLGAILKAVEDRLFVRERDKHGVLQTRRGILVILWNGMHCVYLEVSIGSTSIKNSVT
jgi:hypothetical protein